MEKKKLDQVLLLNPDNELHFQGPFGEIVTRSLVLTNPSEKKVCFKVKTTAPKRYCVRPNSGIIDPHTSVNIAVMLQPLQQLDSAQVATELKSKHKFMIQSIFVDDSCVKEPNWKDVDSSLIMDSKLRCVFDFKPDQDSAIEQSGNDTNALMTSVSSSIKPLEPSTVSTTTTTTLQSAQQSSNIDKDLAEENQKLKDQITKLREEISSLSQSSVLRQRISSSKNNAGDMQIESAQHMFAKLSQAQHIQILLVTFIIGLLLGVIFF